MTTVALAPAALLTRRSWYGSVGAMFAGLFANAVLSTGPVATRGTWTSWYSLAIIAVTLPSAWLGARLLRLRLSPALS